MKLKYLMSVGDRRNGKPHYYYFRHGGKQTRIRGEYGSSEFMAHYRELLAAIRGAAVIDFPMPESLTQSELPKSGSVIRFAPPGSVGWVIERYLTSKTSPFQAIKASSQENYRRFLQNVIKPDCNAIPMIDLNRGNISRYCYKIAEERNSKARGVFAKRLLSILWQFAVNLPEAKISDDAHNPARDVDITYKPHRPHAAWPDSVQTKFLDGACNRLKLAFYLLLYTGQRRSDIIKMKWADYDERSGRINVVQQKTGARVSVPVHRDLVELLTATTCTHENILTSTHGKPYLPTSLTHAFVNRLKKVGIDPGQYTLHGLRKTAGVKLAEAGATESEIMRMFGHSKPDQAHAYCADASSATLTASAMAKWEAHDDRKKQAETDKPKLTVAS